MKTLSNIEIISFVDQDGQSLVKIQSNKKDFWLHFRSKKTLDDVLFSLLLRELIDQNTYNQLIQEMNKLSFILNIERDGSLLDSTDYLIMAIKDIDLFARLRIQEDK